MSTVIDEFNEAQAERRARFLAQRKPMRTATPEETKAWLAVVTKQPPNIPFTPPPSTEYRYGCPSWCEGSHGGRCTC